MKDENCIENQKIIDGIDASLYGIVALLFNFEVYNLYCIERERKCW